MRKLFSLAFFFFPLYFPGTKHSQSKRTLSYKNPQIISLSFCNFFSGSSDTKDEKKRRWKGKYAMDWRFTCVKKYNESTKYWKGNQNQVENCNQCDVAGYCYFSKTPLLSLIHSYNARAYECSPALNFPSPI